MSSTRYVSEDAPFRPEAYASSGAHGAALPGNLVALRCKAAMRREHRTLCYFIQQLSHRDGGLHRIVGEIIAAFPERFCTATMRRLGIKPGCTLSKSEHEAAQDWFPCSPRRRQRRADAEAAFCDRSSEQVEDCFPWHSDGLYEMCRAEAVKNMEEALRAMCLDPRTDLAADPFRYHMPRRRADEWAEAWWINDFVGTLELFRQRHIEAARGAIAETEITRQVHDAIKRATFAKGLAVVEGLQRSGKTTAAENYCQTHPGECVFIELESGEDDISFYRSLARSIGTASSSQLTTVKLRGRIEDMLQAGHLTVVIDESHFLAPIKKRPTNPPKRLDWIRRSLLDKGVPVVFLSTPQFDKQCAHFQTHLSWNADQLLGRIVWKTLLPSTLPEEEVEAVARKIAPYADAVSIKLLTAYTVDAPDYLFRIRRVVDNARYLADQDGRSEPTRADIKAAIADLDAQTVPRAVQPSQSQPPAEVCHIDAAPLRASATRFAEQVPPALARRASMDSLALNPASYGESERLQFNEAAPSD